MRYLIAVLLSTLLPASVQAQIVFNEIAWMGSLESANDEWIELYNASTKSIDLTGWSVRAVDGDPSIPLIGSIAGNAYFVLERTDDDSAPEIDADQLFNGSLSNNGEVLQLVDPDGVVVDSIDGLDAWSIGGDNTSKNTLQRVDADWITSAPTPGNANNTIALNTKEFETVPSLKERKRDIIYGSNYGRDKEPIRLVSKPRSLEVLITEPVEGSVGVPLLFDALLLDEDGDEVIKAKYSWNLGDGTISSERNPKHTYQHAGEYVIVLDATYKKFGEIVTAHDRVDIEILPAEIEVTSVTRDFIELTNFGELDVNLSYWKLQTGKQVFIVPDATHILAGASLRFPHDVTKLVAGENSHLNLFYPSGHLVPQIEFSPEPQEPEVQAVLERAEIPEERLEAAALETENYVASLGTLAEQTPSYSILPWILGLFALIASTSIFALLGRRRPLVVEGYTVLDEKDRNL